MILRSTSSADRPIRPAGELRRLRNDVLIAVAIKILAIAALALAFFGPSHRPHVTPGTMFSTPGPPAPAKR